MVKATAAVVVGLGITSLVGCGENPAPVASQSVDQNDPSPSASETATTPEADPLSPESIWNMSEEEMLKAVRIPEGTSPEEWTELYAKYTQALLNAAASKQAFYDYRENSSDQGISACSKYVYNKIMPAIEQLHGSAVDTNGYFRLLLFRACVMNSNADLSGGDARAIAPVITYRTEMVKEADGNAVFNSFAYDNVNKDYVAFNKIFESSGKNLWLDKEGKNSIMTQEPTVLVAKNLHYDKNTKSMAPTIIKQYAS